MDIKSNLLINGTVDIGGFAYESPFFVTMRKDQNAESPVQVKNATVGTAAKAVIKAMADAGGCGMYAFSSSYTTTGVYIADSGMLRSESTASGGLTIGTGASAPLILFTSDTERMRILGTGYVGINQPSPTSMLHVAETSAFVGSGTKTMISFNYDVTPGSAQAADTHHTTSYISMYSGTSYARHNIRSLHVDCVNIGSGTVAEMQSLVVGCSWSGSNTTTGVCQMLGVWGGPAANYTHNFTSGLSMIDVWWDHYGSGTVGYLVGLGLSLNKTSGSATYTNTYGVKIDGNISAGTSVWALYNNTAWNNYLGTGYTLIGTTSSPPASELLYIKKSDNSCYLGIDGGASNQASINFYSGGAQKWGFGCQTDDNLYLYSSASAHTSMWVEGSSDNVSFYSRVGIGVTAGSGYVLYAKSSTPNIFLEANGSNLEASLRIDGTGDTQAANIQLRDADAGKTWYVSNIASASNALVFGTHDGANWVENMRIAFAIQAVGIGGVIPSTQSTRSCLKLNYNLIPSNRGSLEQGEVYRDSNYVLYIAN